MKKRTAGFDVKLNYLQSKFIEVMLKPTSYGVDGRGGNRIQRSDAEIDSLVKAFLFGVVQGMFVTGCSVEEITDLADDLKEFFEQQIDVSKWGQL